MEEVFRQKRFRPAVHPIVHLLARLVDLQPQLGGQELADSLGVPLLGKLPLVRTQSFHGTHVSGIAAGVQGTIAAQTPTGWRIDHASIPVETFLTTNWTGPALTWSALSFTPGRDLVKGGVPRAEAWSKNYTATMYHQPADEYSPSWDFTGMAAEEKLAIAIGP